MLYVFAKHYRQYCDWAEGRGYKHLMIEDRSDLPGDRLGPSNCKFLDGWEENRNYHDIAFRQSLLDCCSCPEVQVLIDRVKQEQESTMQPWDKLRKPSKEPIGTGDFYLGKDEAGCRLGCRVEVRDSLKKGFVCLQFGNVGNCSDIFCAYDLRQLAQFATELADQLEGK